MSKVIANNLATRDGVVDLEVKHLLVRDSAMENLGEYKQGIELKTIQQYFMKDGIKFTGKAFQLPLVLSGDWEVDSVYVETYGDQWDHSKLFNKDIPNAHDASAIGFKQSGSGVVERSVKEKLSETISILDKGGVADGDGQGGGTDNSDALYNALYSLTQGGTLVFPNVGTGVYSFSKKMVFEGIPNNITIKIEDGVVIDMLGVGGASLSPIWHFKGTIEDQKPLATEAKEGDEDLYFDITGASIGDTYLLHSNINSIHPDAGKEWQLGIPTGYAYDDHACYFAEPVEVAEVLSDSVKITSPLIFPRYPTSKDGLTSALTLDTSFVRKINFLEGIKIVGGHFLMEKATGIFFTYCKNHGLKGLSSYHGNNFAIMYNESYSMYGKYVTSAERDPNTVIGSSGHSTYNTVKVSSSWYPEITHTEKYGVQTIDITYVVNGVCNIGVTLKDCVSYNALENGLTFHAGTYGWTIDNCKVYNSRQTAFLIRSRFGTINGITAKRPNPDPSIETPYRSSGLALYQFSADVVVNGANISGYDHGIRLGGSATIDSIPCLNIVLNGVIISKCRTALLIYSRYQVGLGYVEPSYTHVSGSLHIDNCHWGIDHRAYVCGNDLTVTASNLKGTAQLVRFNGNCVDNEVTIKNISEVAPQVLLVRMGAGITDFTAFPPYKYPTSNNIVNMPNKFHVSGQDIGISSVPISETAFQLTPDKLEPSEDVFTVSSEFIGKTIILTTEYTNLINFHQSIPASSPEAFVTIINPTDASRTLRANHSAQRFLWNNFEDDPRRISLPPKSKAKVYRFDLNTWIAEITSLEGFLA